MACQASGDDNGAARLEVFQPSNIRSLLSYVSSGGRMFAGITSVNRKLHRLTQSRARPIVAGTGS